MEAYEEIYNRMINKYIEESGDRCDEASDIAIRMRVLAGEIYNMQTSLDWLKRQLFANSADGEYLEYFARLRGLERKSAQKAVGELTFYVNAPKEFDIFIPKGTVVATSDINPLRFVTAEDGILYAGADLISPYAEAECAGSASNISVNQATVAVSVPIEIDGVNNREPFKYGTDNETDEALRQRIRQTYDTPDNGTNASFYKALALSVEGIAKASVVGRVRGAGTVNVYVSGEQEQASTIAVENAQSLMNEKRELNTDVLVVRANCVPVDLYVFIKPKSGYTNEYAVESCRKAFVAYLGSLQIGEKVYLSGIGSCLMNTGCIENYTFAGNMTDVPVTRAELGVAGEISIRVN